MFDVKKLAKLLEKVFTRDNENFSPELVADEIERCHLGIIDEISGCESLGDVTYGSHNVAFGRDWLPDDHMQGMGFNPKYKEHCAFGPDTGIGNASNLVYGGPYDRDTVNLEKTIDCVVIGNKQKSDKPNQLKIGNNDISVSRDTTDEEFEEILETFKCVRGHLQNQK